MREQKVNWGILSTAKIATTKVIPALQISTNGVVAAIASRHKATAQETAQTLDIETHYGSYEALLNDPKIDAIYNPLPNHMHVEWTIKALQAGKHVLCEKPIGMNATEAETLLKAVKQFPNLKVMEAFMYRFQPQWGKIKQIISDGTLGEIMHIQSHFSYHNTDPKNIRNIAEVGGGALMDIGCYCISLSRAIYETEPIAVLAQMTKNPISRTDIITSAMLKFTDNKTASFTCATKMAPHQQADIFGTKGHLRIEIPFNQPSNKPLHLYITTEDSAVTLTIPPSDQYTKEGEAFAQAILQNTAVPTPLVDALHNMVVIDAIKESAQSNTETPIK